MSATVSWQDGPAQARPLDDFTLVVPTYNRPDHLGRLLAYYRREPSMPRILVLDSSRPEVVERNRAQCAALGERCSHHEFESSTPVAAKLHEGLCRVETRFCGFCADDDVVFLRSVRSAMTYLEASPSHVCCDGIYLNFHEAGHDVQLRIEYASDGIESDHPGARVFRLMQRYESLFYGVFRTHDLTQIFSGVRRIDSLHYQELFQAVGALLVGKSHRLPVVYAGRQSCEPADPGRDKWQTFYWFAQDRQEFLEHYRDYRSVLQTFYESHGTGPRMDRAGFIQAMDLSHAVFFAVNCPPEYFHSVLQPLWPGEAFTDINRREPGVLRHLMSPLRRWREERRLRLINWGRRPSVTAPGFRRASSIDQEVRRVSSTAWNCLLPPELGWLETSDEFRRGCIDLCTYLDSRL